MQIELPEMIALGGVAAVNHAAATVANCRRAVKAIVKCELAVVAAVGVHHEKIPIFCVIGAINNAAIGSESQTALAVQSSGGDLANAIRIGGGRDPQGCGLIALHGGNGVAVRGWRHGKIFAQIMGDAAHCPAGIGEDPQLNGCASLIEGGDQQTAAIG